MLAASACRSNRGDARRTCSALGAGRSGAWAACRGPALLRGPRNGRRAGDGLAFARAHAFSAVFKPAFRHSPREFSEALAGWRRSRTLEMIFAAWHRHNNRGTMRWDVFCDKARLRGDPGAYYSGNHLEIFSSPDAGEVRIAEVDQFAREMDWMGEVVRGRAPMVSPGEEGLQDMRLIAAILRSVKDGGRAVAIGWHYTRAHDPAVVVPVA
jgi:hypothetical protein